MCFLKRAIYGLKQASKSWYDKCKRVLTDVGFKNFLIIIIIIEPCVYVKGNDDSLCILAVYVDDFLVFGQSNVATNLLNALKKYFELRDLGEAKNVLGMRIKRNGDEISIDQKEYVKGMLTWFKILDYDPISTPVEVNLNNLLKGDPEKLPRVPYQMLIGSLMYAMVCTRPDIAFAVGKLSRYNNCYTMEHWEYAKRVLRYLKATIDYGIVYKRSGKPIEGFVDADWASEKEDRVSCSGFVIKFASGAVAWASRKQDCVATSTAEAEYVGLELCAKKAIVLHNILEHVCKVNKKSCSE